MYKKPDSDTKSTNKRYESEGQGVRPEVNKREKSSEYLII